MLDPFVDGRLAARRGERRDRLCARAAGGPAARYRARLLLDPDQGAAAKDLRSALDRVGRGLWRQQHRQRQCDSRLDSDVTARTFGFAAGMDYHVTPNTIFGFALAGGGTNWGLANASRHRPERRAASRRLRHHLCRAGLFRRRARLHQSLVHDQSLGAWRPAHRQLRRAKLRRAARERLSLRALADAAASHPMPRCRRKTSTRPLQRDRRQRRRLRAVLRCDERHRRAHGNRQPLRCADASSRHATLCCAAASPGRTTSSSNPALAPVFETLPGASFTVNGAPIPHDSALTSAGAELFLAAALDTACQVRRRVRLRFADLRRHRHMRYTW